MPPQIRATEYFCPTCPNSLLLYAERTGQMLQDVYLPREKKMVTVFFDLCYCRECTVSVWIQRDAYLEIEANR